MSKRGHRTARAVAFWCLLAVGVPGCTDKTGCEPVCSRPFEMAEAQARARVKLLQDAPPPWPEMSKAHFKSWLETHRARRDAYVPECVAACDSKSIVCQEKAVNLSEWMACGR